jgi:hypothetical protein
MIKKCQKSMGIQQKQPGGVSQQQWDLTNSNRFSKNGDWLSSEINALTKEEQTKTSMCR